MKKTETIQVISLLAGNYDSIANKSELQKRAMIDTWQECLGDLDYPIVLHAVKKCIIENSYPPTIHEIRKNAIEIINPSNQKSAIEAWNEAYDMICHGGYMSSEEFEKHSPEVKIFFGNVRQVTELAKCPISEINTVTKGQFLKQYEIIVQREQEKKILPPQMQNFIQELANKMGVKELTD